MEYSMEDLESGDINPRVLSRSIDGKRLRFSMSQTEKSAIFQQESH